MAPRRPRVQWRPRIHSLLSTTMQTGRSLESSQIQDCNSGKLSKAFHTSIATVTAVRRELCFRKAKKNQNHNNNIMNVRVRTVDRALLFCALQDDFADFSVVCYVGLVYPRPRFGLLSRGEAVRGEPAQYISMRAPETTVVVPNGSHYRDSQYSSCEVQ